MSVIATDRSGELGGLLGPGGRTGIDNLALLEGLHDRDVLDGHRGHLQGIGAEDHKVSELAGLKRALRLLLALLIGTIDGDGPHGGIGGHPLIRAKNGT